MIAHFPTACQWKIRKTWGGNPNFDKVFHIAKVSGIKFDYIVSWSKPSISITYECVIGQEEIRFTIVGEDLIVQLGSLHARRHKEDIIYKIPGLSSSTKYSSSSIQMNE